ncbi:Cryptochrome-2 [Manis pentadactyla]|nr:Cryptochrome-2 [Manis pentadactyla]
MSTPLRRLLMSLNLAHSLLFAGSSLWLRYNDLVFLFDVKFCLISDHGVSPHQPPRCCKKYQAIAKRSQLKRKMSPSAQLATTCIPQRTTNCRATVFDLQEQDESMKGMSP